MKYYFTAESTHQSEIYFLQKFNDKIMNGRYFETFTHKRAESRLFKLKTLRRYLSLINHTRTDNFYIFHIKQ